MRRLLVVIFFLAILFPVMAQEDFYDIRKIQDIRILIHAKSWKQALDSVFTTSGGNDRLMCDIRINGQLIENVGIRYKGYSSVHLEDIKNPFNIDLAYTVKNNNYKGFTSLRLSNVNYDPSFIREALSYEIARKYMPASRANFANVYVNDTLLGLYSNVEAVNDRFILRYFPENKNSFIKGSPSTLEYPFGQNANLADTHGTDSTGYQPYYALESEYGWSDLYHFISVLNTQPDSAAQVLNIDRALWMHAFNYEVLNLDSYIGYSQNYYLYKDDNGIFNTIPWDMNMSFGSFRHSDGSTHFQGLTISQTKQLDPLGLMSFAVSPRPLVTNLFNNDTLKRMFLAHMRTIMEENISNNGYFIRGEFMQEVIDSAVKADTNKFYPYENFHENLLYTVGSSGSADEFPGIKDLMEARLTYLETYPGFTGAPVIWGAHYVPETPVRGNETSITVHATGAVRVFLGYRFHTFGAFTRMPMFDDGNHHDSLAGDGSFGATILLSGPVIQYYFYAENDSAGIFLPARAENEYYSIQPMILPGHVVLNELYAGNGDQSWIELLNTTTEPLNLLNMQLSDDPAIPGKWMLPDTILAAKHYLLINVSYSSEPEKLTAPLTLSASGGVMLLSNAEGRRIDSVSYARQVRGKSSGRYPNGYGSMMYMLPTMGSYNSMGTTPGNGFLLYPNPAGSVINIELMNHSGPVTVTIYSGLGKPVMQQNYAYATGHDAPVVQSIDVSVLGSGIYMVRVSSTGETTTKKLIIY
ncbi:MAG: CotH kinase family protein [Bacteroidales bacterium]|nr:CotH kinase family protein [Bacteroidales bacterium]